MVYITCSILFGMLYNLEPPHGNEFNGLANVLAFYNKKYSLCLPINPPKLIASWPYSALDLLGD